MSQIKYIFHCLRENGWIQNQKVILNKTPTLPTVDEKREDELDADEDAKSLCQKYIGQLIWLSTRTRLDISACLGILATLMVKRPHECVSSLVHLWRYVYLTSELAMTTAQYDPAISKDQWYIQSPEERTVPAVVMDHLIKEAYATLPVFAPVEPMIVVYTDASFAGGGGRSRSGCSIYLMLPCSLGEGPQHILLQWSSRRQTLIANSAPEAETGKIAAIAEAMMPGIVVQDACRNSHILRSANPILKLNTVTDSIKRGLVEQSAPLRSQHHLERQTPHRRLSRAVILEPLPIWSGRIRTRQTLMTNGVFRRNGGSTSIWLINSGEHSRLP
eukprot:6106172-Amphidinium_carterae.2